MAALFETPHQKLHPERMGEGLDVIQGLAATGVTMLVVTHEMGFARRVADRVVFMEAGQIIEQGSPDDLFDNPKTERARAFLSAIMHGAA
ncbi:amino acid ABC transporter ATP-binding protein [Kaistia defluvii]|uniref:amino acid ABC transporter ATP-binding protein n=1 Tax=Kaistia defluvii TaxID=410841 RepID=UPI00224F66AA|nr:amino acid ABC transporter ATP-binding protein [Kaistia defluvii]MCX5520072.1 amino acid ABC transporter ATP-binding protein [Kaistia defluvii]